MKYDFDLHMENENSLSLLLENVNSNSTVLEFGPANGRMTRYMKEKLNCKVYLVELDEEAGREALRYGTELVIGDIENYMWLSKFEGISFDHIIFADVLEHLRNPLKVIQSAKRLLDDKGTILLSVPNLAHNSVLIDLMNNKFEYNATGLLDDTHIHFFTKSSLEKMIKDANMYPCKKMATYAPVGSIEIKNSTNDVIGISAKYWNERAYGEVYQYVYILSKKPNANVKQLEAKHTHYYLEAYYDKDEMWNMEHKLQCAIDVTNGIQKFSFQLDQEYSSVRIDPINTNCVIEIIEAKGIIGESSAELTVKAHNAKVCYNNRMFFDNGDPIIIYNIPDGVNKIDLTIRYIDVDFNSQSVLPQEYYSVLEEMDVLAKESALEHEQRAMYQGMLEQTKTELEQMKAELEHTRNRLLLIEQSKLYKIYKFIYKK